MMMEDLTLQSNLSVTLSPHEASCSYTITDAVTDRRTFVNSDVIVLLMFATAQLPILRN